MHKTGEKRVAGAKKQGKIQDSKYGWPSKSHPKNELVVYQRHPVLYGERKFAREFPKQTQTISFTDDFPIEIRIRIYDQLLLQAPGAFFELWDPRSWDLPMSREDPALNRPLEPGETSSTRNNHRTYRDLRKVLGMLRVCKKVHVEMAAMFYGKRNFRFTNANGFTTMTHWMHTIRPGNCLRLRHITVHLHLVDQEANWRRSVQSITKWQTLEEIHKSRGLRIPNYKHMSSPAKNLINGGELRYDQSLRRGFRYLTDIPQLQRLEIVVPWDYEWLRLPESRDLRSRYVRELDFKERIRYFVESAGSCLANTRYWADLEKLQQHAASQGLKISLVIHHGMRDISQDMTGVVQEHMRRARWLLAYAKVVGYDFGHTHWRDGSYAIRYDEDDLLILPPFEYQEPVWGRSLEPHEVWQESSRAGSGEP